MRAFLREIGLPRLLIFAFLGGVWALAALATRLDLGALLSASLRRAGENGILVLALVPMVRAGGGLNFGLPLGIVCGLLGAVLSIEWGLAGGQALGAAAAVAVPLGAAAGYGYALLLERVRGQEMMVGMYVGFGAVAFMSIVWLLAPFQSPEVIMPIGGRGARATLAIESAFATDVARAWSPGEVAGLLAAWLGAAAALALFDRTRLGATLVAAGENERFATACGVPVRRMRRLGVVLSTAIAALGIVVFAHAYGFVQLYKAPLLMALPAVAALLLGGASTGRATVLHAVLGTFLFQALLTATLPVVNDLVQASGRAQDLSNIPEIARLIIGNGVILYALTRKG